MDPVSFSKYKKTVSYQRTRVNSQMRGMGLVAVDPQATDRCLCLWPEGRQLRHDECEPIID
jgi:hypothetical protein